ncbi:MAG: SLBB domain-containing protein [Capsulimonadaceae bacterium]
MRYTVATLILAFTFSIAVAAIADVPATETGTASTVRTGLPTSAAITAYTATEDLPTDYRLAPGDEIDIAVLGHPSYSTGLYGINGSGAPIPILPDGTIDYIVVGRIQAAGFTCDQLANEIEQKLGRILNKPHASITVVQQAHPAQVSVMGDVKLPGVYDYKSGWRIIDVLAAAGGLARPPDMTDLVLVTDNGKTSERVNVGALMSGQDMTQNLLVHPMDSVLVQMRDPAVSLVQVVGEVIKPGEYDVPGNGAPVLSLLAEAGGPTPVAALSKVQVMHNGKVTNVDLRKVVNNLGDPGVELYAGDVMLVPTNTSEIAVLGEVKTPAVQPIPDGQIVSVAQAVSAAGGFTDAANRLKVDVINYGTGGSPEVHEISLSDQNMGTAGTYVLSPGDVVFVPTRRKGQKLSEESALLVGLAAVAKLLL